MNVLKTISMTVMSGVLCVPVMAQEERTPPPTEGGRQRGMQGGRQFPQLPPEKAKAAWEAQAKRVSGAIGLDQEKTGKVTTSYVEARQSFAEAVKAARDDARERSRGMGREDAAREEQRVTIDVRNHEREKLQTALGSALDRDQLGKAMPLLGAFDVQWDFMVDSLTEMKLDAEKNTKAMDAVEAFVLAMSKVRNGGGDVQALREASVKSRGELDETMKTLLTEEQMVKFHTATNFGRPARGPGGAAPGQGGQGGRGRGGASGAPGAAGGTGNAPDDDDASAGGGKGGTGGGGAAGTGGTGTGTGTGSGGRGGGGGK